MAVEFRAWMSDDAEMRAEGDGMSFTGYAIRWNSDSEPLPFIERIAPGATSRSLKSRNEVKAFVNHDTNLVIGSTRAARHAGPAAAASATSTVTSATSARIAGSIFSNSAT